MAKKWKRVLRVSICCPHGLRCSSAGCGSDKGARSLCESRAEPFEAGEAQGWVDGLYDASELVLTLSI